VACKKTNRMTVRGSIFQRTVQPHKLTGWVSAVDHHVVVIVPQIAVDNNQAKAGRRRLRCVEST